ncbi:MAG: bacterial proteasome activator family protein [Acidimicrobiia bacterium]|nr:bacterial proteasome activator family protein [Acidimicrobiia bacterium]MDH3470062.1 bacterial proteasome activator family protein [Acidimicrobiia bacterium]
MEDQKEPAADVVEPEVVDATEESAQREGVSRPSLIIRIASMTRAMLEEVRQAPLDEAGRKRLLEVHDRSLDELAEVLSPDLRQEFEDIFIPLNQENPSQSELRIAQAQLVGWLEGLFHGIQASLFSQQIAAQAQLQEVQARRMLEQGEQADQPPGLYL